MTCSVLVRDAGVGDEVQLVEQFLLLNRHEDPISGDRRTDQQGAVDSLAAAQTRVRETGGFALVAERDGRLIGHLFLVFETAGAFVREEARRYAYVSELFVRPAHRRAGIATTLLREAERRAAALGARRLRIGVLAGNDPAERAYLNFGFARYAIELQKPIGLDIDRDAPG